MAGAAHSPVDWAKTVVREGDSVCYVHGIVQPAVVGQRPVWPSCRRLTLRARRTPGKNYLEYVEPAPAHCEGPEQHTFTLRRSPRDPVSATRGGRGCGCDQAVHAGESGHRVWLCARCDSEIVWPPHPAE